MTDDIPAVGDLVTWTQVFTGTILHVVDDMLNCQYLVRTEFGALVIAQEIDDIKIIKTSAQISAERAAAPTAGEFIVLEDGSIWLTNSPDTAILIQYGSSYNSDYYHLGFSDDIDYLYIIARHPNLTSALASLENK